MKKVGFVVFTRYSPQKVRSENCRERWRTLNRPVRILAKLRSWNRRKPHFLHQRMTRIWRFENQGRIYVRMTSKRRISWDHWNS